MKKIIIILGLIGVLVAGLLLIRIQDSSTLGVASGKTHRVVLTDEGFMPEAINIKKGDIVEFSTTAGEFYWPASDIHPTHGIYPEFDPRDAIESDKVWSYKFEKVGEWRYHDHLSPYYTGIIVVSN